jgi:acyl-CoA synthetase (AMP-forming)/AMP-acid ligase II
MEEWLTLYRLWEERLFSAPVSDVTNGVQELIKYKGLQVAPADLEGLLLTHSRIQDAAVIGVEIPGTEAPRAYIVKSGNITKQEIKDFVKQNAVSYKHL